MKPPPPRGLSRRRVDQLLSTTKDELSIAARIETFSRHFLGRPYQSNPLIGSADAAEVFTASLDSFDCVTYIETVLALTRARTVYDFTEYLRKIRYDRGRIQWDRRNHYMTLWLRNNRRARIIRSISMPAVPTVIKDRILNVIPGLPPHRILIKCVPKRNSHQLAAYLQTGDLIFFVSSRKHLDVFHAGILTRDAGTVSMRHASRSRRAVVEQPLTSFLKTNRMAGVIVARPQPQKRT